MTDTKPQHIGASAEETYRRYTTAELAEMPDDALMVDIHGVVWFRPGDGRWCEITECVDFRTSSQLAKRKLRRVR